jgi:8-oxo-dGTP pyrophosphatase MutT (NUDIX family)
MSDPIRPAATVILARSGAHGPEVLMGQRGAGAAFMPSKFVFPGGGVDPADHVAPRPGYLDATCTRRLGLYAPADAPAPDVVVAAALRELAEETGLAVPAPATGALRFVFRAITPPGRTRRFDARFLLADADALPGDQNDLSAASGGWPCQRPVHWTFPSSPRSCWPRSLPYSPGTISPEFRSSTIPATPRASAGLSDREAPPLSTGKMGCGTGSLARNRNSLKIRP